MTKYVDDIEDDRLSIALISPGIAQVLRSYSGCQVALDNSVPNNWFNWKLPSIAGVVLIERITALDPNNQDSEIKLFNLFHQFKFRVLVCLHVGESISICTHLPDAELIYLERDSEGDWNDGGDMFRLLAAPDLLLRRNWGVARLGLDYPVDFSKCEVPDNFWHAYAMAFNHWFNTNASRPDQDVDKFAWHPVWKTFQEHIHFSPENAERIETNDGVVIAHKTKPYLRFFVDDSNPVKGERLKTTDTWIDASALLSQPMDRNFVNELFARIQKTPVGMAATKTAKLGELNVYVKKTSGLESTLKFGQRIGTYTIYAPFADDRLELWLPGEFAGKTLLVTAGGSSIDSAPMISEKVTLPKETNSRGVVRHRLALKLQLKDLSEYLPILRIVVGSGLTIECDLDK